MANRKRLTHLSRQKPHTKRRTWVLHSGSPNNGIISANDMEMHPILRKLPHLAFLTEGITIPMRHYRAHFTYGSQTEGSLVSTEIDMGSYARHHPDYTIHAVAMDLIRMLSPQSREVTLRAIFETINEDQRENMLESLMISHKELR